MRFYGSVTKRPTQSLPVSGLQTPASSGNKAPYWKGWVGPAGGGECGLWGQVPIPGQGG